MHLGQRNAFSMTLRPRQSCDAFQRTALLSSEASRVDGLSFNRISILEYDILTSLFAKCLAYVVRNVQIRLS